MSFATALVDDWLYGRLASGPGRPVGLGGVHPNFPPQGTTAYPCLVYFGSAAPINRFLGPRRGLSRFVYTVKVVAPTEAPESLRPILAWLDSQIQSPLGQPYAPPVVACDQDEIIAYTQVADDGVVWSHYGARYAIQVDAA